MSPTRTSKAGSFRFDRIFRGVGRVQLASGAKTLREFNRRDALLTKLYEQGRLDLLRGFQAGTITMAELVDADRREQLATTRADHLTLRRPLWVTVNSLMAKESRTFLRYRQSLNALKARWPLHPDPVVRHLADVDWEALCASWGKSAADWNHVRRAVSRFLGLALGKLHPVRVETMARFPSLEEVAREPDMTPKAFRRVLTHLDPIFQPYVWGLVGSGLRAGEFWQLQPTDLMPLTQGIRVRRKVKSRTSYRVLELDPWIYAQVAHCVPAAIKHDRVLRRWEDACKAAGYTPITLHDLRHCYAQWSLENPKVRERDVQKALGHKTEAMTRKYASRKQRREVSMAVARVLGVPQSVPQAKVRKQVKRHA